MKSAVAVVLGVAVVARHGLSDAELKHLAAESFSSAQPK